MSLVAKFGDISIYFDNRASALCVVTFSHMDFRNTGPDYWGQQVLGKLNVSAVGVVCARNTWFPTWQVWAALKLSRMPWLTHEKIISYGSSMGGYAALRHGRAFGANAAIALAPQASIKPALCQKDDLRYASFFRPHLHWDAVVKHPPNYSFAVHDPSVKEDDYQSKLLKRLAPEVEIVRAFHMGHEVVHAIDQSAALMEAIEFASAGDLPGFHATINSGRRRSARRAFGLGASILDRRPQLANRIVHTCWEQQSPWWRKRWVEIGGADYVPTAATELTPTLVS